MPEQNISPHHWLVITNPTAGKRQFRIQSKFVKNELEKAGIPFIFKLTEYSGHAIKIAKHYTENGCLNFLILGGDGTISEVINGIFAAKSEDSASIKIAILPRGTGNDWGRFWKITKNSQASIDVFFKGKTQLIDIGKIDYRNGNNQKDEHFFINSIGFGLDAEVVAMTHKLKKYFGSFSLLYTIALVAAVFKYKPFPAQLKINDIEINKKLFTMNIANGPYTGGGIKQNPFALPYDGVFDMMVVGKPTFKDIVTALPKIFNGKLYYHPVIETFQTKEVKVKVAADIPVEADGIILHSTHNCVVSIIPNAIQMIVP